MQNFFEWKSFDTTLYLDTWYLVATLKVSSTELF